MSRSYRHEPWVTDGQGGHGHGYKSQRRRKIYKRMHHKIIRKILEIPNGSAYRLMGIDPWSICDYKFDCSINRNRGSSPGYGIHCRWLSAEDRLKSYNEARRK